MLKVTSAHDQARRQEISAQALGFSGLLPFWSLPFLPAIAWGFGDVFADDVLNAAMLYGAVIVSFMSGGRWAFRVVDADRAGVFSGFLGAVTPALIAWAVVALPQSWLDFQFGALARLGCLAALLIFQLFQDRDQAGGVIPPWYMRLRQMLVTGATTPIFISIILAAFRA